MPDVGMVGFFRTENFQIFFKRGHTLTDIHGPLSSNLRGVWFTRGYTAVT